MSLANGSSGRVLLPAKTGVALYRASDKLLFGFAFDASCIGDRKSISHAMFVPINCSAKTKRSATAYVKVGSQVDVLDFKAAFEGRDFGGKRCSSAQVSVEYAPLQRVPGSKVKRDPRENTIEQGAG